MTQPYIPSEVIEMAWCDKTSFDAIEKITGLCEKQVITLMRLELKPASFRLWRKRVTGRKVKHEKKNQDQQIERERGLL